MRALMEFISSEYDEIRPTKSPEELVEWLKRFHCEFLTGLRPTRLDETGKAAGREYDGSSSDRGRRSLVRKARLRVGPAEPRRPPLVPGAATPGARLLGARRRSNLGRTSAQRPEIASLPLAMTVGPVFVAQWRLRLKIDEIPGSTGITGNLRSPHRSADRGDDRRAEILGPGIAAEIGGAGPGLFEDLGDRALDG
jgi:hypothetical protein